MHPQDVKTRPSWRWISLNSVLVAWRHAAILEVGMAEER